MAKLVPAVCPNCGAELELPEKLDRAFCTYCGKQIIISKTEKHYHVGTGSVENLFELGRRAYTAHDFKGAIKHLEEALEIDAKHKKVNNLIKKAYYQYALKLIDLANKRRDLAKSERRAAARVRVGSIGNIDDDDVEDRLDDLEDELAAVHRNKANTYIHEAEQLEKKAKVFFRKAGVCPECRGSKYCANCSGSGWCPECKGSGSEYLVMTCSECQGYRYCVYCRGWRLCTFCRGTGLFQHN
jgi:DNA-directed RNA polymerase subunit RPC12/RpoP